MILTTIPPSLVSGDTNVLGISSSAQNMLCGKKSYRWFSRPTHPRLSVWVSVVLCETWSVWNMVCETWSYKWFSIPTRPRLSVATLMLWGATVHHETCSVGKVSYLSWLFGRRNWPVSMLSLTIAFPDRRTASTVMSQPNWGMMTRSPGTNDVASTATSV